MAQVEFRVGYQERHSLRVDISPWTGSTRVWIDGKELPRDKILTTGIVSDFQIPAVGFMVGEKESHRVEVRLKSGLLDSGFEVFVDGQPQIVDG